MDEMAVHVENKEDLRISVEKDGSFLCIRGYECTKQCTDCPLHKVGEDLENLNTGCELLKGMKPVVNLKVKFHVSEKIIFV